jgi:hypothetical protein
LLLHLWGEEIRKILRLETLVRAIQEDCFQQFTNSTSSISEGLNCTENSEEGAYIALAAVQGMALLRTSNLKDIRETKIHIRFYTHITCITDT